MRAYLDDWAIHTQSQEVATLHTQTVLCHSEALGFHVNLAKSDLTSSQTFLYLIVFNTLEWSFRPSTDRMKKLHSTIRAILGRTHA